MSEFLVELFHVRTILNVSTISKCSILWLKGTETPHMMSQAAIKMSDGESSFLANVFA